MRNVANSIAWNLRTDAEPQGGSDGFWYDITIGGYIKPELLLLNSKQVKSVTDAVALLLSFEQALEEAGLLNEF